MDIGDIIPSRQLTLWYFALTGAPCSVSERGFFPSPMPHCLAALSERRFLIYAASEYITDAANGVVKISSPMHSEPLHLSVGPNKFASM